MENENNVLCLCGVIEDAPALDHEVFGEQFFRMNLRVPRLSGAQDLLPVTVSERLMNSQVAPGVRLCISGQLRSYNKVVGGAGRLLLTAFAQRLLAPEEAENPNLIQLTGAICKPPAFGKSDYIPCIAWGRTARYAATLQVGDKLRVQGRFQSREYQKQMPDGTVMNRTAYEVSLSRLTCLRDEAFTPEHAQLEPPPQPLA